MSFCFSFFLQNTNFKSSDALHTLCYIIMPDTRIHTNILWQFIHIFVYCFHNHPFNYEMIALEKFQQSKNTGNNLYRCFFGFRCCFNFCCYFSFIMCWLKPSTRLLFTISQNMLIIIIIEKNCTHHTVNETNILFYRSYLFQNKHFFLNYSWKC